VVGSSGQALILLRRAPVQALLNKAPEVNHDLGVVLKYAVGVVPSAFRNIEMNALGVL